MAGLFPAAKAEVSGSTTLRERPFAFRTADLSEESAILCGSNMRAWWFFVVPGSVMVIPFSGLVTMRERSEWPVITKRPTFSSAILYHKDKVPSLGSRAEGSGGLAADWAGAGEGSVGGLSAGGGSRWSDSVFSGGLGRARGGRPSELVAGSVIEWARIRLFLNKLQALVIIHTYYSRLTLECQLMNWSHHRGTDRNLIRRDITIWLLLCDLMHNNSNNIAAIWLNHLKMKKSKIGKELEKLMLQKSGMQGVIQSNYMREDVHGTWELFSDSARRSIFYVADAKAIAQINAVNTSILCKDILKKTTAGTSAASSADTLLNAFEILWNLSNAAGLDEQTDSIDPELIEIARKMEPGTHLMRIKNEYIPTILQLIEKTLDNCFEGRKTILPDTLYYTLFPERLMKTWEDFEVALAFMLENMVLRAHIDRLTHIYKEQAKAAFEEFTEAAVQSPEPKKKQKKKRRTKHKRCRQDLPIPQPVGEDPRMKCLYQSFGGELCE